MTAPSGFEQGFAGPIQLSDTRRSIHQKIDSIFLASLLRANCVTKRYHRLAEGVHIHALCEKIWQVIRWVLIIAMQRDIINIMTNVIINGNCAQDRTPRYILRNSPKCPGSFPPANTMIARRKQAYARHHTAGNGVPGSAGFPRAQICSRKNP